MPFFRRYCYERLQVLSDSHPRHCGGGVYPRPIVLRMIQDRDFKRQVEGKKPMRELGENESIPQEEQPINPAAEAEAARARATSMQNLMGPK